MRARRALAGAAAVAAAALLGVAALAAGRDGGGVPAAGTSTTTSAVVAPSTTSGAEAVVGTPGAAGIGDPYFPGLGNGGYDAQHYHLALTWHPDDGSIQGVTTMEALATQDLSRFNLDLAGLDVTAVTVDGEPAGFQRADRELEVTPSEPIADGRSFTTVVTYGGVPVPVPDGTDPFDVGWQRDGREAYVVSEPAGAATFFPVNDHPRDKATYTIDVTAPDGQVVAANGLLQAEEGAGPGLTRWTYEAPDPMAPYLVQIAIGDYELVDGGRAGDVVIRHAFHRTLARAARTATARTAEMIDVLDDVFGPYPFAAYGVVAVDEELGFALETQTLTIIGSDVASRGRGADVILLHELAHQWVGDAVGPATWRDIWLNEGFATYAEWIWSERTGGPTAAQMARAAAGRGSGLDHPPGDPGTHELFSPTVYLRGGMALQALRERIGDDAFFTLLRRWVDDNSGSVASTEDLVALAEEVSGQDLDDLFQAWLYGPELPDL